MQALASFCQVGEQVLGFPHGRHTGVDFNVGNQDVSPWGKPWLWRKCTKANLMGFKAVIPCCCPRLGCNFALWNGCCDICGGRREPFEMLSVPGLPHRGSCGSALLCYLFCWDLTHRLSSGWEREIQHQQGSKGGHQNRALVAARIWSWWWWGACTGTQTP